VTAKNIENALRAAGISAERRFVGSAETVWAHEGETSAELGSHGDLVFVEFFREGWSDEQDAPTATFVTIDQAVAAVREWFAKPA
jgi:hypothetical protein